jgi:hypothetical protein
MDAPENRLFDPETLVRDAFDLAWTELPPGDLALWAVSRRAGWRVGAASCHIRTEFAFRDPGPTKAGPPDIAPAAFFMCRPLYGRGSLAIALCRRRPHCSSRLRNSPPSFH